jgi:hypothetical protein
LYKSYIEIVNVSRHMYYSYCIMDVLFLHHIILYQLFTKHIVRPMYMGPTSMGLTLYIFWCRIDILV